MSLKKCVAREQFHQDAADAPNVARIRPAETKDDLRGTVMSCHTTEEWYSSWKVAEPKSMSLISVSSRTRLVLDERWVVVEADGIDRL